MSFTLIVYPASFRSIISTTKSSENNTDFKNVAESVNTTTHRKVKQKSDNEALNISGPLKTVHRDLNFNFSTSQD